jgi:hypothetical protein
MFARCGHAAAGYKQNHRKIRPGRLSFQHQFQILDGAPEQRFFTDDCCTGTVADVLAKLRDRAHHVARAFEPLQQVCNQSCVATRRGQDKGASLEKLGLIRAGQNAPPQSFELRGSDYP